MDDNDAHVEFILNRDCGRCIDALELENHPKWQPRTRQTSPNDPFPNHIDPTQLIHVPKMDNFTHEYILAAEATRLYAITTCEVQKQK